MWGGETFFIIISRQAKVEIKFPAWICQNILGGSVCHEIVDIETEFDNSLAYLSWAHMGSNREKNRVRKISWHTPFKKCVVATSVACQTAACNGSGFESCISHTAPPLLEKYSKFPRYNIKSRGKRDTTWNIPRSITLELYFFLNFVIYVTSKGLSISIPYFQLIVGSLLWSLFAPHKPEENTEICLKARKVRKNLLAQPS